MTERENMSRPGLFRWWVLLVVALAVAALALVGRDAPVRTLETQPVNAEPVSPPTLTDLRAV